jgi:hypothetical protein
MLTVFKRQRQVTRQEGAARGATMRNVRVPPGKHESIVRQRIQSQGALFVTTSSNRPSSTSTLVVFSRRRSAKRHTLPASRGFVGCRRFSKCNSHLRLCAACLRFTGISHRDTMALESLPKVAPRAVR